MHDGAPLVSCEATNGTVAVVPVRTVSSSFRHACHKAHDEEVTVIFSSVTLARSPFSSCSVTSRAGYMTCVPINIVVVNSQPAEVLMERLVSWLRANGAQLDKLALVWCIALGLEVPRWT